MAVVFLRLVGAESQRRRGRGRELARWDEDDAEEEEDSMLASFSSSASASSSFSSSSPSKEFPRSSPLSSSTFSPTAAIPSRRFSIMPSSPPSFNDDADLGAFAAASSELAATSVDIGAFLTLRLRGEDPALVDDDDVDVDDEARLVPLAVIPTDDNEDKKDDDEGDVDVFLRPTTSASSSSSPSETHFLDGTSSSSLLSAALQSSISGIFLPLRTVRRAMRRRRDTAVYMDRFRRAHEAVPGSAARHADEDDVDGEVDVDDEEEEEEEEEDEEEEETSLASPPFFFPLLLNP